MNCHGFIRSRTLSSWLPLRPSARVRIHGAKSQVSKRLLSLCDLRNRVSEDSRREEASGAPCCGTRLSAWHEKVSGVRGANSSWRLAVRPVQDRLPQNPSCCECRKIQKLGEGPRRAIQDRKLAPVVVAWCPLEFADQKSGLRDCSRGYPMPVGSTEWALPLDRCRVADRCRSRTSIARLSRPHRRFPRIHAEQHCSGEPLRERRTAQPHKRRNNRISGIYQRGRASPLARAVA